MHRAPDAQLAQDVNYEHYRAFTASIKAAYAAPTLQECQKRFDEFVTQWEDRYPGAVRVWQEHRLHVEQLFNYTSAIRKIMYTTLLKNIQFPFAP